MKILRLVVSSTRFLLSSSLVFCLVSAFASAGIASDQKEKSDEKQKVVRQVGGSAIEIREYTLIPEATEACTPEEAEWWGRFRKAGNDLYKKSDEKTIKRFYLLMLEGLQKAYRIPLKDRPPHPLLMGRPTYLEMARKHRIEGFVELSVEYRADGSVGDIQIIKRLGGGLDEVSIQAARQAVFLPAIKDGSFVASRQEIKFGFDLPGGKILDKAPTGKKTDLSV